LLKNPLNVVFLINILTTETFYVVICYFNNVNMLFFKTCYYLRLKTNKLDTEITKPIVLETRQLLISRNYPLVNIPRDLIILTSQKQYLDKKSFMFVNLYYFKQLHNVLMKLTLKLSSTSKLIKFKKKPTNVNKLNCQNLINCL
jgi:hypothetical protein